MDTEFKLIWEFIESWPITPELNGKALFNPGASISEIQAFEQAIGFKLPQDVVDSYRRHNGMPVAMSYYCFWQGNSLSLKQSLQQWRDAIRVTKEIFGEPGLPDYYPPQVVKGPVKALCWSPAWIPVLKKNKEPVCLDFEPAEGGNIGQVIEVDFEGSEVKVIAKSYREFLQKVVENL